MRQTTASQCVGVTKAGEYAVETGAGCDTAARGMHAAAVPLRMCEFVQHGKNTCRIEMQLGTLCAGMVRAKTNGWYSPGCTHMGVRRVRDG